MFRQIPPRIRLPRNSMDLLHAANLRQGTVGFSSPPKEGVLRNFLPLKIRRFRPSLYPRTWVPKASKIPVNHRNRSRLVIEIKHRDVLCTTVCSESFRTADTINSVFVNLFLTMFFFVFSKGGKTASRRQGNYMVEDALKLSDYDYRWKRCSIPSKCPFGF